MTDNRINRAISALISAADKAAETSALKELAENMIYPPAVYNNSLLAEDHQLKKEALYIIDAFEAVTNGMINPDAMNELENIGDDSIFIHWKHLIYSISAAYSGDEHSFQRTSMQIPADSPLAPLKAVLLHMLRNDEAEDPLFQRFLKRIFSSDNVVQSSITQLQDALENGLEDVFFETARLLLLQIKDDYFQESQKLCGWIIVSAGDAGFDLTWFLSFLNGIYGPQEGFRLAAVNLMHSDPDISLYFLLKALLYCIHDSSRSDSYIQRFLTVARELVIKIENDHGEYFYDNQYRKSIEELVSNIAAELKVTRSIEIAYEHKLAASQRIHEWLLPKTAAAPQHPKKLYHKAKQAKNGLSNAIQLELF